MIETIINRYKKQQKYKQLTASYGKQYAFIGSGMHALNNLYPVLNYLHVPLKYIVTHSAETANKLNVSASNCHATTDLDMVLNDPQIAGIFISTPPRSHYDLVKRALEKNKHVFVEKPPCQTKEELQDLILTQNLNQKQVLVGLQKRYSPVCRILRKKIKMPDHYIFRYCLGAYPEGNTVFELFIHPIDLIVYLFGKADIKSIIHSKDTVFIHLMHAKGTIGSVELSTGYSWGQAEEQMIIVEKNNIYELNNLSELLHKNKPATMASIPLEKVLKFVPETKVLYNQNTFVPTIQQNNLYMNGFYSELEAFVHCCENEDFRENKSDLSSLQDTYKLLEKVFMSLS